MNINNNGRQTPTSMPCPLQPKAVPVTPIRSQVHTMIGQPMIPIFTSTTPIVQPGAQGSYIVHSTTMLNNQRASLPQTLQTSQPRMCAQLVYPHPSGMSLPVGHQNTPRLLISPTSTFSSGLPFQQTGSFMFPGQGTFSNHGTTLVQAPLYNPAVPVSMAVLTYNSNSSFSGNTYLQSYNSNFAQPMISTIAGVNQTVMPNIVHVSDINLNPILTQNVFHLSNICVNSEPAQNLFQSSNGGVDSSIALNVLPLSESGVNSSDAVQLTDSSSHASLITVVSKGTNATEDIENEENNCVNSGLRNDNMPETATDICPSLTKDTQQLDVDINESSSCTNRVVQCLDTISLNSYEQSIQSDFSRSLSSNMDTIYGDQNSIMEVIQEDLQGQSEQLTGFPVQEQLCEIVSHSERAEEVLLPPIVDSISEESMSTCAKENHDTLNTQNFKDTHKMECLEMDYEEESLLEKTSFDGASPQLVDSTIDKSDTVAKEDEEQNGITQEKFHESVLYLRANKNGNKTGNLVKPSYKPQTAWNPKTNGFLKSAGVDMKNGASAQLFHNVETDEMKQDCEADEPEFIWEDYLNQVGAVAVPHTAFKHVECSLRSGFVKGMKLEVPNKSCPETFWVASVIITCGQLLRMRYDGYGEDGSGDFWCDLFTSEVHPIGWCAQNGKNLQPPDDIKDRTSDWRQFLLESLTGARTAPSYLLDKESGSYPVDQLKCGMMLELQDALNPLQVWLVQILENVGGRLYLRLEGTKSASKHFWMFYLNSRLHPIGWAAEENCVYKPPHDIYDENPESMWEQILQETLRESSKDMIPADVFKDQPELRDHHFEVGMKLEALYPGLTVLSPATVVKVINEKYFMVEIDDMRDPTKRESIQICCHLDYLGIFPASWSICKGIKIRSPAGWTNPDFAWGEYLSYCNAKAAPERLFHLCSDDHEFERGMKLEAVNPDNPNQICAATITKVGGPLLWIHLDHIRDMPSHIEFIDSHNLFPIGWCESNNCTLKQPLKSRCVSVRQRRLSECHTQEVYRSIISGGGTSDPGVGSWCPKMFFNHRCFSGPYLSKGRVADLPKFVGPGPMDLVLKEVLSRLVNVAYKSIRALKEIQLQGTPNPYMKTHMLKAKYKGKIYQAPVQVCQNEDQIEEFCRNICIKLECCPYLFSPLYLEDNCPENCQQLTKTKYNYNYGKKKKPYLYLAPKPTVRHNGGGEKVPGKRGRKKKRFHLVQIKSHCHRPLTNQAYDANGDMANDEGFEDDYAIRNPVKKNKLLHQHHQYDIQTRGFKGPKYSFERRTHKKIFMSQSVADEPRDADVTKKFQSTWIPEDTEQPVKISPREGSLRVDSNPLEWSVQEVIQFLKTTDCAHLARIIKDQEIDGQAFLLMNLQTIQEHLNLKLGPAVKLCHQIELLKVAFFEQYA